MSSVLLFGGTREGHLLAKALVEKGQPVTLSVATEYGEMVLEPALRRSPLLEVHSGRLDEGQMEEWLAGGAFGLVIDATHPYAALVTRQIRDVCGRLHLPLLRCLRPGQEQQGDLEFGQMEEAVRWLEGQEWNILLTTGTKDLEIFRNLKAFEDRVYARVLPAVKSLEICLSLGLKGRHIIAMQGPFSVETNLSQLREFDCRFLVTKNAGSQGGYSQKLEAAKLAGATSLVIGRPEQESGLSLEETIEAWSRWKEHQPEDGKQDEKGQANQQEGADT